MKRYLYLVLLIFPCNSLLAQAPSLNVEIGRLEFKAKQVIPPAPEAAELGRYGNAPVSYYTGTTNISVPIYDLTGQFLSLPISLSHNASGFKPEDPATWVGLNWSLNAGGVIARSVIGNPDNSSNYFGTDNLTFPVSANYFTNADFMHDMKIGIRETDPDFYTYNFAGNTGKFFILPNSSIVKKERNNLAITHCISCTTSSMEIVDEAGATYQFSDVESSDMLLPDDEVPDGPAISGYSYPSSWYLTQVVSANGREKFLLEYYTTGQHMLTQNTITNKSVTYSKQATTTNNSTNHTTFDSYAYVAAPPTIYTKRKFLKKVTLVRDGRIISYVDFESASNLREDADFPEVRLLQRIKVYSTLNNISNLVKDFSFSYSYFTNTGNTFTKKRLRLDSLKEVPVGTGTAAKPAYRFEYNTTGTMPERFTRSLDHWGFFNATNNSSLVPTVILDPNRSYGDGANREPNLAGASYGIINKITYPTGGYTTFDYELNDAAYNDAVRLIGGIRIKKITDYAANTQKATARIFEYQLENGATSGNSDVGFPKYVTESRFDHQGTGATNPDHTIWKVTVSANSLFGLGTIKGSHIGYSRVTESAEDVNTGARLGKTIYDYYIGPLNPYDEDIRNGDLLKQSVFDNNGKLLEEVTNTNVYNDLAGVNMAKVRVTYAQNDFYYWCKRGDSYQAYNASATFPSDCDQQRTYYTQLLMDKFVLKSQERQLVQTTLKKYDQLTDTYILSTRKNTYTSTVHTLPTVIENYTTGNEEVITRKKYAGDYVLPGGAVLLDNVAKGISVLKGKNMLTTEIESVQYRQNLDGSNKRYIGGQVTNYGTFYPVPVSTYRLETAVPLTTLTESTVNSSGVFVGDSHYKPLGVFGYDGLGNLTEQAKANDAIQSVLWDYNDSYPVAVITNANQNTIAFTSFETDTIRSNGGWIKEGVTVITTNAFTGKRACNLGTGRVYKLFTSAINKPVIVAYWSRNGALTVKQNNTTNIAATMTGSTVNGWTYHEHLLPTSTSQIAVSATNAIIDELRLYPEEAQMTTCTYDPLVGVTSQTDAKGLPVSYDYDGYGRLINVKDEKGAIRQNLKYNYGAGAAIAASAPTLFYNRDTTVNFTKIGCSAGEPEVIAYRVPAGKYVSAISLADVTSKVVQDITANGQTNANTTGRCLFYNVEATKKLVKNDCPPENGLGKLYTYIVPARKYNSPINQAAADTLAAHDIRDNAQAAANANGECVCGAAGQKLVNNVCETGTRVNIGSWQQPDGQWKCVYVYHFSDNTDSEEYTEYNSTQCPVL